MAGDDRMLDNAAAAGRGIIPFRGGWLHLDELMAEAIRLQDEATQAKKAGEHSLAVSLYQELLPLVQVLEELDAFKMPQGLPTQQVQRAIELEQEANSRPPRI